MKIPKDCLSCYNSFSIPSEESKTGEDEMYCANKQRVVMEDGFCEEYE